MDRTLRGTVTRTDGQGVYVEVPKLGLGVEFGPCQVLTPPILNRATDLAGTHGHSVSHTMGGGPAETAPDHRHTLTMGRPVYRRGDAVLVTTINGVKDDLAVLGLLA